jgi:hypothetical protein
MMRSKSILLAVVLVLAAGVMGCTTTQEGTVVGGGIGAGAGAIIGNQTGDAGEGALIGGALGALSGAIIGHEIDKSKQPPPPRQSGYEGGYYQTTEPSYGGSYGGDYYEGDRSQDGRMWVPEHKEVRVYTAPDGSKYEKTIVVPGHYE